LVLCYQASSGEPGHAGGERGSVTLVVATSSSFRSESGSAGSSSCCAAASAEAERRPTFRQRYDAD
jgi:hypothetical protein